MILITRTASKGPLIIGNPRYLADPLERAPAIFFSPTSRSRLRSGDAKAVSAAAKAGQGVDTYGLLCLENVPLWGLVRDYFGLHGFAFQDRSLMVVVQNDSRHNPDV